MDRLNTEATLTLPELRARCEAANAASPELIGTDTRPSAQERIARIVRTIEADIIPRLVRSHRLPAEAEADAETPALPGAQPGAADVLRFVALVLADQDGADTEAAMLVRERRMSVETLYMDLLAPAARELGRMWEEDETSFSDVTVAVGRLQRIMRGLSPAFGSEVDLPADGRRALLLPAPGEQHTFGLTMVAEFFRRAGWDVVCELDARTIDPVGLVRAEWFDVIGISAGGDARIDWLKSGIAAVRHASRNRAIGVMVGGPIFTVKTVGAADVGADAASTDGRQAPILAEQLLNERARRL